MKNSAMQMTAVYACVRILSEAVAGLPLNLFYHKEDGGKEKAISHPLYHLLHDEPNPEMSSFVFRHPMHTKRISAGTFAASFLYTTCFPKVQMQTAGISYRKSLNIRSS